MNESGNRIGGGVSRPAFAARFVIGFVIGTALRFGVWLLPDVVVESVKRQL